MAIGTRLKRAGLHCNVSGSNAIISLRLCKLSRHIDDFWKRRSERMTAWHTTFLPCPLNLWIQFPRLS